MTSEKRSPTYVVYHFDTQRLSPTRVCKKIMYFAVESVQLFLLEEGWSHVPDFENHPDGGYFLKMTSYRVR